MASSTTGIRNRNPGNLRSNIYTQKWLGYVQADANGFCVFDTPEHGVLAIVKQLRIDKHAHTLNTVRAVISRWAPSSENDTQAYIAAVCKRTGFQPDQVIDLDLPMILRPLVKAIIYQENGQQPYPETLFDKVVF